MKTRLLVILGIVIFPLVVPQGFALCITNDDWPDAPCFDQGPASHSEFNKAWAPYYEHKGAEWMESKKIELDQVLEEGNVEEWVEELENYNVYRYYLSRNEIQSQLPYDGFFVTLDPNFGNVEFMEQESEPESVIDDVCGPTVLITSDICDRSLSQYPIIIITAFVLIVGLFVYWFSLGKKK